MDGDLCYHDDVCDFLLGFYDDVTTNNTRTKTVRSPYKPYEAYVTHHKHPYKARTRKILQCNYFIIIKDHSHLSQLFQAPALSGAMSTLDSQGYRAQIEVSLCSCPPIQSIRSKVLLNLDGWTRAPGSRFA